METMAEDLKFIGQMAKGVKFKKVESNTSGGGSTSKLTKKYFSQIDNSLVKQLYQYYKVDFEMFGYQPDKFI